jgi:SIR2-like domain
MRLTLRMQDEDSIHPLPFTIRYLVRKYPVLFLGRSFRDYNLHLIWRTLRRRIDAMASPSAYVLDPWPDPLLIEASKRDREFVFIKQDIWSFVPQLYQTITA